MESADRISSGARGLRWLALASAAVVAIMIVVAIAGLLGAPLGALAVNFTENGEPDAELAVAFLSGVPFLLGLLRLAQMMRRIERGEVFTAATIAGLRGFAFFVLLSAVASILVPPLLAIARVLAAGARQAEITFSFDGGDFFVLLVSALLFLLARLLGEAQRLDEDNRQIV